MNDQLTFTDRESYLTWKAAWKEVYFELSATIRKTKQEFKEAQQAYSRSDKPEYYGEVYKVMEKLRYNLSNMKEMARQAIELRHESRILAGELRNEAKVPA